MKLKMLYGNAMLPSQAKPGDAGLDLVAQEDYRVIPPGESALIQTGISVQIPTGMVGLVCSRSGMALKHGVFVLNAPGVVDSGYRGEVGVILHNTKDTHFHINRGDRIAQLVLVPFIAPMYELVTDLDDTERGTGGFGSTGA